MKTILKIGIYDVEDTGEMIVCMCRGVTDRDVDQVISSGADSVDDVVRRCGAGGDCGTCLDDICERLSRAPGAMHAAA